MGLGQKIRGAGRKVKRKLTPKPSVPNQNESGLSDFMQAEMAHARLGVLYIFSNTKVHGNLASVLLSGAIGVTGASLSAHGKMNDVDSTKDWGKGIGIAKTPIDQIVKFFEKKGQGPKDPKDETERSLWQTIKAFFQKLVNKVWTKLCHDIIPSMEKWGAAIKAIISGIVGIVVAEATPLAGILDIVSGVTKSLDAAYTRISTWLNERKISLINGHPTAVVDALKRAMNMSIGEGLWQVLKGSLQIGLDAVAVGAGALSKAIAGGCELIVKVIYRIFEVETCKVFAKEAKAHWATADNAAFHEDAEGFSLWYQKYALKVPAIGAITLNCGYCGGPMQYLNMYNYGGTPITQGQFDLGVSFLASLKRYAAKHLNDIGIGFSSQDKIVQGALDAAKNYGKITNIRHNNARDVVVGLLTG